MSFLEDTIRKRLKAGELAADLVNKEGYQHSTVYRLKLEIFGPSVVRKKAIPLPDELTRKIDHAIADGLTKIEIAALLSIDYKTVYGYMQKKQTSVEIERIRRVFDAWPAPVAMS